MVHVLLEAELEHNVGLVEHEGLEVAEINVLPFDVVKNPTGRADEDIDAASELADLVIDVDASVDGDDLELVVPVLELVELIGDLYGKLASGGQDDGLELIVSHLTLFPEPLDQRESESESLSRSCQIPSDQVVPMVHRVEAVLLDGEEALEPLVLQAFNGEFWDLGETQKLAIVGHDVVGEGCDVNLLCLVQELVSNIVRVIVRHGSALVEVGS
mmetsp:Transcript_12754/g.21517  ORF Transcript_12754/g.21517 Transcript_12754/m.21517 type:complete len:215 (-) Transcript_12754:247-891(-)